MHENHPEDEPQPATADAPRPPTDAEPAETPDPRRRPPRWLLPLLAVLIAVLVVANLVANAFFSSWVEDRPLLLVSLNASMKYCLLTSNSIDLWAFMILPTLRLLAADPLFYILGSEYGDRALKWGRRVFPGSGPVFEALTEDDPAIRRLLDVLVFLAPNNVICLVAGVVRYPVKRFIVLNLSGTVGRMVLLRWLAARYEGPIDDLVDTISGWRSWLLPLSIVSVVLFVAYQFFGDHGMISGVRHLEEDLEDEA